MPRGDPSFPFAIGVDLECLPGRFRLTHLLSGALRVEWAGAARTLLPGSLPLVPPRSAVRVRRGPDARTLSVCFAGSLVDPLLLGQDARAAIDVLGSTVPITARLGPEDHRDTLALLDLASREYEAARAGYEAMIRLKLLEVLLILARSRADQRERPAGGHRFDAEEAKRYIREHCADPLSLGGLAARYGSVIAALEAGNPGLAEEIKKRMFVFEDIVLLQDADVMTVLEEIQDEDLVLAMKAVGPDALAKLWACLGGRAGALRAESAKRGPVRLVDADAAQQRIVAVIRRMEEEGRIIINRAGADLVE